jgi:hypothetical protein
MFRNTFRDIEFVLRPCADNDTRFELRMLRRRPSGTPPSRRNLVNTLGGSGNAGIVDKHIEPGELPMHVGKKRPTSCSSETSARVPEMSDEAAGHSSSTPCDMSHMWTRAPASANIEAIAWPIPAAPAVTRTRSPVSIANRSGMGMRASAHRVWRPRNARTAPSTTSPKMMSRIAWGRVVPASSVCRAVRRRTPPIMPK